MSGAFLRRDRMARAHHLAQTAKIVANGRKTEVVVNCQREPRFWHRVWIRRFMRDGVFCIDGTCVEANPIGDKACPGNGVTACVHVLAATAHLAHQSGWKLRFCKSEQAARQLARLGGEAPVRINGRRWEKPVWAAMVR